MAYLIEEGQVEVSKKLDGQTVHLASLRARYILGEMSMIDEKPRSATVTAVTTTVVSELRPDHFFNSFQTEPKVALALLRVLCERLREAHTMILRLQRAEPPQHALVPTVPVAGVPPGSQPSLTLEGITPRAAAALPVTPFEITQFPFRIGRQSPDPLVYNDLMLPDSVPLQISRHHLALIAHEGRVGVVDRGSTLGSWVDGQQLGGPSRLSGPVFFAGAEAILVLGNRDSPFRYRVSLRTEGLRDAPGSDS
jgi:Cyclic nucleotide-binding domain/FHA domain